MRPTHTHLGSLALVFFAACGSQAAAGSGDAGTASGSTSGAGSAEGSAGSGVAAASGTAGTAATGSTTGAAGSATTGQTGASSSGAAGSSGSGWGSSGSTHDAGPPHDAGGEGASGTGAPADAGSTAVDASTGGADSSGSSGSGPCDIYAVGGTPCVAAHSTIRSLFAAYGGKLYQVRNATGATQDISATAPGGAANAAMQDSFCAGTTCVITVLYDQTGRGNDLQYQGSGSPVGGEDHAASATGESVHVGGSKAYSLYINQGNSYWVNGSHSGIPTGSQPEGMYMVTSGTHFNGGCCFDYGNSETDRKADGAGAMDAINFSAITMWGKGAGAGPWVMADLEYGLFSENSSGTNANDPSMTSAFVMAMLKNDGRTEFSLRGANAAGGSLATYYKGPLPNGWSPMKKQGAIALGSGGDCCATDTNLSEGTFYEGCVVSGYPSDATEEAVQANVASAQYAK